MHIGKKLASIRINRIESSSTNHLLKNLSIDAGNSGCQVKNIQIRTIHEPFIQKLFYDVLADALDGPQAETHCFFIRNREKPLAHIDIRRKHCYAHCSGIFNQCAHLLPRIHGQAQVAGSKASRVVNLEVSSLPSHV